jgi:hypothetical protein
MRAYLTPITLSALLLAAPALTVSDGAAAGQTRCGARADMVQVLGSRYKENRRVMGVVNARVVMEIFVSAEGTWTVLVTDTEGRSCITAAGDNWQEVPAKVAGLES